MTPQQFQALIDAAGLNQTSTAKKLGFSRRTIIRWLDGTSPISAPNADFIRKKIKPAKN